MRIQTAAMSKWSRLAAWGALALWIALAAPFAQAQGQTGGFTPEVGQPGKDVIWVPTPEGLVEKMLQMAEVRATDFIVDLGSGDGRIAITAAKKFGARSLGIEYNPDMVALSIRNAADAGVTDLAKFIQADIFETDFSRASVVTMYLLPDLNIRLRPKILGMRPGTRVVSHRFNMGDWEPDATEWVDSRQAHLWIVPANVEGVWHMSIEGPSGPRQYDVTLKQQYQKVEGELKRGIDAKLFEARLAGDTIGFHMMDGDTPRTFVGHVNGAAMSGVIRTQGLPEFRWSATR
jgi:hypothetical protein